MCIVWWIFWRGVVCGALLGAAFGTLFAPLAGTFSGFLFGIPIGVIMGTIDAFALGAIAHFFMDMNNPSRIVMWLRLISITLNLIGVSIYIHLILGINPVTFIGSVLAAIAAYVLCPRFVKFAVDIQQLKPNQSTSITPLTQPKPAQ